MKNKLCLFLVTIMSLSEIRMQTLCTAVQPHFAFIYAGSHPGNAGEIIWNSDDITLFQVSKKTSYESHNDSYKV